jgi:hypothetical protein
VTSLRDLLKGQSSCNPDLSEWHVSKVVDAGSAFEGASSFNQDISAWDVQSVTSMLDMFNGAASFNQKIGAWNVANLQKMSRIFLGASIFDQPTISDWDTSGVREERFEQAFLGSGMSGSEPCWFAGSPQYPCRKFQARIAANATLHGQRQNNGDGLNFLAPDNSTSTTSVFRGTNVVVQTNPFYIAPPIIDTELSVLVHGKIADITYEIRHISVATQLTLGLKPINKGDWYVNQITGVVTGMFRTSGIFQFDLWAVDLIGNTARLETYRWEVNRERRFEPKFTSTRNQANTHEFLTNYDDKQHTTYVTGKHFYQIAALMIDSRNSTVSAGNVNDITYRLKTDLTGWFVETRSGLIVGNFQTQGTHQVTLVAVDAGGQLFDVETYTFEVKHPAAFILVLDDGINVTSATNIFKEVGVGDQYSLPAPKISAELSRVSEGSVDKVTFALVGPASLCMKPSGEIQGVFTRADIGSHALKVTAFDEGGHSFELTNTKLNIRLNDDANPSFGPNKKGCGDNGEAFDKIPFDESFTCNCGALISGDNCQHFLGDVSGVDRSSGSQTNKVGGILGGLLLLILLGGAFVLRRARASAFRATDFKMTLALMLESGEINM